MSSPARTARTRGGRRLGSGALRSSSGRSTRVGDDRELPQRALGRAGPPPDCDRDRRRRQPVHRVGLDGLVRPRSRLLGRSRSSLAGAVRPDRSARARGRRACRRAAAPVDIATPKPTSRRSRPRRSARAPGSTMSSQDNRARPTGNPARGARQADGAARRAGKRVGAGQRPDPVRSERISELHRGPAFPVGAAVPGSSPGRGTRSRAGAAARRSAPGLIGTGRSTFPRLPGPRAIKGGDVLTLRNRAGRD